jgi:hypothetical protein
MDDRFTAENEAPVDRLATAELSLTPSHGYPPHPGEGPQARSL